MNGTETKSNILFVKNRGNSFFWPDAADSTTGANASMLPVHDRMPLILEKNQVTDWILESDRTESLLRQLPPLLERNTEYEQLSFF